MLDKRDLMILLGVALILGGLLTIAYWVLFVSWSHSSFHYRTRTPLMLIGGPAAVVAGFFVVLLGVRSRRK